MGQIEIRQRMDSLEVYREGINVPVASNLLPFCHFPGWDGENIGQGAKIEIWGKYAKEKGRQRAFPFYIYRS